MGQKHAVANAFAQGDKTVDVNAKLGAMSLQKLPFQLVPELAAWQLLQAENEAAFKVDRVAFAYVDLTHRAFLPAWLTPDDIGGKSSVFGIHSF